MLAEFATGGWSQVSSLDFPDKSKEVRKIKESLEREREVNTLVSQKILIKNQSAA